MAYVIGSQKGKDKAEEMKVGEKWTATDGSTWEKKSDGSVSVTHNGQTYDNAYKSSGGSSGGGGKNSQYSAPNLGNTWDSNTDYQAIINKAVKAGDYVTAAKAEQLRNQKIIGTGSNYDTTNLYKGWLDNTDYSTKMFNGMANGMSAQDMQALYNGRFGKANGTVGLEQYANDNLMQIAQNYINQQLALEQQQGMLDQWEADNPKEDYQSNYDSRIDSLLTKILNRDDFSYDVEKDPLYQQYAAMYQREGDRAMRNTLAEAAASAGGMNTYATTAAMQANNYYNSQLNDRIPELYQLAYNMYLNDKESMVQDLGILQNMDATQYGRYRDTINDWYNDKNFAYNAYQNAIGQGNWQTNHNYNADWANKNFDNNNYWANKNFDNSNYWAEKEFENNNYWAEKEFNTNQEDKEYNKGLYDQESAREELWKLIALGVTPSADLISRAGMSETDVALAVEAAKKQLAQQGISVGSSGGGSKGGSSSVSKGGSSSGSNGWTGNSVVTDEAGGVAPDEAEVEGKWTRAMSDLGLPRILSADVIVELVEVGAIYDDINGKTRWNPGWNPQNWEEKLKALRKPGTIKFWYPEAATNDDMVNLFE